MSSKLRCTACLRAWRRSWVVLSSSTDTRRPRSAMRSMVFLRSNFSVFSFLVMRRALPAGPTLPHAELEHREVRGAQKPTRSRHDFGRTYARAVGDRQELGAGFALGAVALAQGRHQRLERLRGERVELARLEAALDLGGEPGGVRGSRAICGRGALLGRLCHRADRRARRGLGWGGGL